MTPALLWILKGKAPTMTSTQSENKRTNEEMKNRVRFDATVQLIADDGATTEAELKVSDTDFNESMGTSLSMFEDSLELEGAVNNEKRNSRISFLKSRRYVLWRW